MSTNSKYRPLVADVTLASGAKVYVREASSQAAEDYRDLRATGSKYVEGYRLVAKRCLCDETGKPDFDKAAEAEADAAMADLSTPNLERIFLKVAEITGWLEDDAEKKGDLTGSASQTPEPSSTSPAVSDSPTSTTCEPSSPIDSSPTGWPSTTSTVGDPIAETAEPRS